MRPSPELERPPAAELPTVTWTDWSCRVRVVVDKPGTIDASHGCVKDLMAAVARSASRFRHDSDLSAINRSAGRPVAVGALTVGLVHVALDAAAATGGLCDPTVGLDLIRAGYDDDIAVVRERAAAATKALTPSEPSAEAGRRRPEPFEPQPAAHPRDGWRQVRVDDEYGTVTIPARTALDLGATAKAWTAEIAAETISHRYGTSVLVEIGGDLAVRGAPGRPWRVEITERPDDAVASAQTVRLSHGGLATSSTRERTWTTGDGVANHVIDPRTGRPSRSRWRTASVWAPSVIAANALSTAALCGDDAIFAMVARAGAAARLVAQNGRVVRTHGWPLPVGNEL